MELGNLFSLSGRIGRKDFIIVSLALIAFGLVISAIYGFDDVPALAGLIESIVSLVIGIPIGFKRLHDTNKSGWWLLIGIIPIVGWIVLFIVTWILPGDAGENRFGTPNDTTPFPSLHST